MLTLTERAARWALCLLAFSAGAKAAESCNEDKSICIESLAETRGVSFWIQSGRPGTITIMLDLRAKNLRIPATGQSYIIRAGRQLLFVANVLDPAGPWDVSYRFFAQDGSSAAAPNYQFAYAIPFAPELNVRVSQGFHGKFSHHDTNNAFAIDFDVPEGTPVYAAREGRVVEVVQRFRNGGPTEPADNVNVIKVEHADLTVAEYAHLRQGGAAVTPGQWVKEGELIGYSGNTGRTNGPHLHFAVHVPIDGKNRRSIPIRFAAGTGESIVLEAGQEYRRAPFSPGTGLRAESAPAQKAPGI